MRNPKDPTSFYAVAETPSAQVDGRHKAPSSRRFEPVGHHLPKVSGSEFVENPMHVVQYGGVEAPC